MTKKVTYLHYGHQCYGYRYMAKQAEEVAKLLNMKYEIIDIENNPDKAAFYEVYSPMVISIDGFQIPYPGKPELLAETYQRRGPLDGIQQYQQLTYSDPDKIELLQERLSLACTICWSSFDCTEKAAWLKHKEEKFGFPAGLIAFFDGKPVAALEWVPESEIPYPIPKKRPNTLFITCVYNKPNVNHDYRQALIKRMKTIASDNGYEMISVIAGLETPYPNGPQGFLESCGFVKVKDLGKLLLMYKWEEIALMECKL